MGEDTASLKPTETAPGEGAPRRETMLSLYTAMLRIRMFEEKVVELYPDQEMKCPVHLCIGQEAVAAGVCLGLEKADYVFSNHRGHGHYLAKGGAMGPLMAEFYGKATGCSNGKGGSMHIVDMERSMPCTSAIVGGGIPMGVGAALASAMKGDGRVSVIFFGDGAFDEGAFHESMNFAALKRLPAVFVCENNLYATNSPQSARQPLSDIAGAAGAFGVPGARVDGNDAIEVYAAGVEAVERARNSLGPTLIEARTYRWKGHVGTEEDHKRGCRSEEELRLWKERCPVRRLSDVIARQGAATAEWMEEEARRIRIEIEEAVAFAKASPFPAPEELLRDVYGG
jgi:pyruvate dehydrogenase E1 component alpha subunit